MDETFVVGSGLLAPTMNMYFAMGDSGQVVTSAFVSHVIAKECLILLVNLRQCKCASMSKRNQIILFFCTLRNRWVIPSPTRIEEDWRGLKVRWGLNPPRSTPIPLRPVSTKRPLIVIVSLEPRNPSF
jgi:hypothetical protein